MAPARFGQNLARVTTWPNWATVVFDRFNLNKSRNQHGNTNKHLFRLDSPPKTPREGQTPISRVEPQILALYLCAPRGTLWVIFRRFNLKWSSNQHRNTNKHLFRLDSSLETPQKGQNPISRVEKSRLCGTLTLSSGIQL